MPLALTTTDVLAQAVACALTLGPTLAHPLRAEVANIELEASNVRMLLMSALDQTPYGRPLADIQERLVDGRRLDVIEAHAVARR